MKRRVLILLLLLAGLLMACETKSQLQSSPEEESALGIAIEFPEMQGVKSSVGELPASDLENVIHTLTVWVFRSDDKTPVSSPLELDEEDFPVGGGVRRYSIPVSNAFAAEKPPVDVFVLANAASIGLAEGTDALTTDSDWSALHDAFFGDSDTEPYYGFGLGGGNMNKIVHSVDPDLGLPMSAYGQEMAVEGEDLVLRVRTLKLKRMVSRLRFVFCKTRTEGDEAEEVAIKSIKMKPYLIPLQEYVFTSRTTGIRITETELNDNYDERYYEIPGLETIAENDNPEALIYVNQDPITYDNLLNEAVDAGKLTDLGYTYFRESDQRLSGTIEYEVDGKSRVHEFNMATAGDFARNHTWTVFGYFLSGRNLQLALNVLPWDYNLFNVDFSEESLNVKSKFRVDETSAELIETSKDHYDVHLLPGLAAKGHLTITTPVGGKLMIKPSGNTESFVVDPTVAFIDPTVNNGRIDILVRRNPDSNEDLTGHYITLSFSVEAGERVIDANTEAVDIIYKFIL